MTTQTASTIFGHQMLISFASRVIGRGASALIKDRAGINKLQEVQLYLAKQNEAEVIAKGFLKSGDDKVGEALVRADTEALKAEVTAREKIHEIATDPALAKKHNLELTAKRARDTCGRHAHGVTRAHRTRDQCSPAERQDLRGSHGRGTGCVRRAARKVSQAGLDDRRESGRRWKPAGKDHPAGG